MDGISCREEPETVFDKLLTSFLDAGMPLIRKSQLTFVW